METNSKMQIDVIDHPSHYTSGGLETIDIMLAKFGEEITFGFCIGNVLKYLTRFGKKDLNPSLQDLKKADWYLDEAIKLLEEAQK